MSIRRALSCALVVFAALILGEPASAQTLYGSLTGNVTDATGSAVPGVKVDVLNTGTGLLKSTLTDERGVYSFNDLQVGAYKLTFTSKAFSTRVVDGVSIAQNTTLRVDSILQVSQVQEEVTVSASTVTLQTDRADINHVIRSTQITDLPIMNSQGRNFQAIYKILPGFTPPGEVHSDSGNPQRSMATQANGMAQSNNNTKVDGATISHPWLPRIVAYVPPVEALETVNIVTNSFDAEQGMAGGAAVNVSIKSGTNEFHGAAWEFHNNSAFKARNYFYCLYSCTGDPDRAPKDLQNQFGGAIGGPIKKN
ncbi:MAG: carboxypeptidase regulatory-like domain-containing protein, partial [Acidobacteria bacterium]|nr:carboxypeptidase regulatory-like domain-containing protein [Acidobacteriota bacterium]